MAPKRKSRSAVAAQQEEAAEATTPAPASMAGAVVFGLHHLRKAIFAHHAHLIVERRNEVFGTIDRPGADVFATELSFNHYSGEHPRDYFAGVRHFLESKTNLFTLVKKLGLTEADWLQYLLDHPRACNTWLSAYTSVARGRASENHDFESYPQARQGSGSAYEHVAANPMEMFYYQVRGYGYHRGATIWTAAKHPKAVLLRDDHGRTYIMNLADGFDSSFMLQAVSRCPELLYGESSPFFPVYDAFWYDEGRHLGAVISHAPPWPLARSLAPGLQRQVELRRLLERARDLFSHLATLEKYGISLDGQAVRRDWSSAFGHDPRTPSQAGPWLLPAYLDHSVSPQEEGKLARIGRFEEKLPAVPLDAWPGAGKDTSRLPWSHFSAYLDPRVPGPKMVSGEDAEHLATLDLADVSLLHARSQYLYGVTTAQWNDESFKRRMKANATAPAPPADGQGSSSSSELVPESRFHEDLISAAQQVVKSFFHTHASPGMTTDQRLELLETTVPSDAYEACLRAPATAVHGPSKLSPSPLFLFCPQCARKDPSKGYPPFDGNSTVITDGRCPHCYTGQVVTAMPMTVRHLLLRILRPTTDTDGNMVVVTAKEAHDTLEAVLKSETPKLESVYNAWCQVQDRVVRLDHPRDLDLQHILDDDNSHRLLLLEHLRGKFLWENLRRSEWFRSRMVIRDNLTNVQKKQQVALRAACGDKEAAAALAIKIEEEEKAAAAAAAAALVKEEKGEEEKQEAAESDEEYSPSSSKKKGKRGGKGGARGSKKRAKK